MICDLRHCVRGFFLYNSLQLGSVRNDSGKFQEMTVLLDSVGGTSGSGFQSCMTIMGELEVSMNFFDAAQEIFSGVFPEASEDLVVSFHETHRHGDLKHELSSDGIGTVGAEGGRRHKTSYVIRLANTQKQKKAAKELIGKMYSWRNYQSDNILQDNPRLTTFVSYDGYGRLVGTVTVGLDSPEGLFAEEVYRDEVTSLRLTRGKICEFTCLAVLPEVRSRKVLGGLFHVAMIYASRMFNHNGVVFEVTPRHGQFYENMLGMNRIASGRICKRVNTPSVLIYSDFSHVEKQVEKSHQESAGDSDSLSAKDRSLYRHFFNRFEETGIIRRFEEIIKKEKSGVVNAPDFSCLSSSPLFASN